MALPKPAPPVRRRFIPIKIIDISTADQVYFVPGYNGMIVEAFAVIDGAITNSDAVLTLKINDVPVTNGTITVPFEGSAAGAISTLINFTPLAAKHTFDQGLAISIETDGASTGTVAVVITLGLEPV